MADALIIMQGRKGCLVSAYLMAVISSLQNHGPAPFHVRKEISQQPAAVFIQLRLKHIDLLQIRHLSQELGKFVQVCNLH